MSEHAPRPRPSGTPAPGGGSEAPRVALPGPAVGPQWLAEHLGEPGLVVLDASMPVVGAEGEAGAPRRAIPGARRFDIEGDFSDPASALPHTMLPPAQFSARVRGLGIDAEAAIVVYDDQGIYSSARAWWMLAAMGHEDVAVLDGGLPGWIGAGQETEFAVEPASEPPSVEPSSADAAETSAAAERPGDDRATPVPRPGWFVDADGVAEALEDDDAVVLDARSAARFAGTAPEPRPGLRSGHMPGAVNLPFTELLDGGFLRPRAELEALIDGAVGAVGAVGAARRIVTSCGSGVTAAVPALIARLLGRADVAVYDGSWSEWGRPGPRPVEGPGRS